jgi:hypothetical protein
LALKIGLPNDWLTFMFLLSDLPAIDIAPTPSCTWPIDDRLSRVKLKPTLY